MGNKQGKEPEAPKSAPQKPSSAPAGRGPTSGPSKGNVLFKLYCSNSNQDVLFFLAGDVSNPAAGNSSNQRTAAATPPPPPVEASVGDYSHFNNKLTINDFDLLKVLGKGSFGKVMLVKKKDDPNGTLYAMKTLRKAQLIKRNQLAHTSTERHILQNIHCPFLVHLVYAFQTPDKLYMVLDYMAGGELFFWLKKDKKFSENRSRLYTAEITMAIEALHSADIVYRDLKPENIL